MARFIWRGNTENEVNSGVFDGRSVVKNLTIINRVRRPVKVNIIIKTSTEGMLYVSPQNMTLAAGSSYRDWNLHIEDRDEIIIRADGKVDFHFSLGEADTEEPLNR